MRILLTTVLIWLGTLLSAQQDGIRATIDGQISAFSEGDFAAAFEYASPTIQSMFGSPDRFEFMVRSGYPMVVSPQAVQYLDLTEIGGGYLQKVLLQDPSGQTHILIYQMIEWQGSWRINGVGFAPLGQST